MKYAVILLTILILFGGTALAQTSDWSQMGRDDPHLPWDLTADQIFYDQKTEKYIAVGNVLISKQDRKISADHVEFDHKNMKAVAQGDVVMNAGADLLTGSRIELDLKTETGTLYNGTVFLQENHFYIKGDRIEKVGPNTYTAQRASITTCDGPRPDWTITSRNLKVTIEGYGHASHPSFWAKKIPLAYAPYMFFPVKRNRQSGFLAPQFGHSDRKGEEYIQPFFWAINESSDATFYLYHMGRRGEKLGVEYRYVLDADSKGIVMLDYLKDKKIDDGKNDSNAGEDDSSALWSYPADGFLRPNSDRYWFRMKHNQALPAGFSGYLDLDIVRDQDYLREFTSGYTGFDHTEKIFNKFFGREIDEYTDTVRVNRFYAGKAWSNYSLNADMRWYDDIIDRTHLKTKTFLQKLPLVEFNGLKQELLQSPFFFDLDSEYTHFFRIKGQRGQRVDLYPRLYFPTSIGNYLAFEPSLGFRTTTWHIYHEQTGSTNPARTFFRHIYDYRFDFSSEVYRIFDVRTQMDPAQQIFRGFDIPSERELNLGIIPDFDPGAIGVDKIKHSLRPQVIYNFTPKIDQSEYPTFDGLDRIGEIRSLTYSLTNTLTARSLNPSSANAALSQQGSAAPPSYTYNQLAYLKLEQSYDINEATADKIIKRPFSNITADLQFNPSKYLALQADAQWSPYDNRIVAHNELVKITDKRGDNLSMEHRYAWLQSESFYAQLYIKLNSRLAARAEYEVDMRTDNKIRSNLGFSYTKQCWSFDVYYVDEPLNDEQRYEFLITLHGIGEIGARVSGFGSETSTEESEEN